jgi:hypothetical protein
MLSALASGQARAFRLRLIIFRFVERLVNRDLRPSSIAPQYPNLKLGFVAVIRTAKHYAPKARSSRGP